MLPGGVELRVAAQGPPRCTCPAFFLSLAEILHASRRRPRRALSVGRDSRRSRRGLCARVEERVWVRAGEEGVVFPVSRVT